MNSDLANILGNLVNRTISMSNKYFGGVVENKGESDDPVQNGQMLAGIRLSESKIMAVNYWSI